MTQQGERTIDTYRLSCVDYLLTHRHACPITRDMNTASRYTLSAPVVLTFTREFISGALVGLTHDDALGFCDMKSAEEYVAICNKLAKRNGFKIISHSTKGRA